MLHDIYEKTELNIGDTLTSVRHAITILKSTIRDLEHRKAELLKTLPVKQSRPDIKYILSPSGRKIVIKGRENWPEPTGAELNRVKNYRIPKLTPVDYAIHAIDEIIKDLNLKKMELMAILPGEEDNSPLPKYIVNPVTGHKTRIKWERSPDYCKIKNRIKNNI